jgi:small subunit ribosomal protein S4
LGAPKRNRSHFEKPKERWNLERIKSDRALINEFGLKNHKELWKVQTEVSRIRGNVRELLSVGSGANEIKDQIIGRLTRLGVASSTTTLDNLLDLKENDLLNRRLQTIVFRKGMAKSVRQARQLTVHGFIAIDGRKVNRPGYLVDAEVEKRITYYKPIDISPQRNDKDSKVHNTAGASETAVQSDSVKTEEPAKPEGA